MLKFLEKSGGVYNASEMGLGKSIQTIVTLRSLPGLYRTLIICPAVVRLVWRDEIRKWGSLDASIGVLEKFSDIKKTELLKSNWVICSYDFATKFAQELATYNFGALVCDESHQLKSTKAKRTKAILKHLWPATRYHICLSGTPFTNNVIDGYSLFHKLCPEHFPDWYSFANTYAHRKHNGFGITYEGLKNEKHLSKIIKENFFLRYKKSDVLPELPPKQFIKIALPSSLGFKMNAEQEAEMKQYHEELRRLLGGKNVAFPVPPITVAEVRHKQGLLKVKPIVEFVKNLLDQKIPCVLGAIHRNVIEQFVSAFKDYNPSVIHGGTLDRHREIEHFQSGSTDLFIGQLQAAGTGITLTRSTTVILAEYSYSPAEIDQFTSRAHRIGSQGNVSVYYFSVEDSIDEKIAEIVMEKANNFYRILDDQTT